MNKVKFLAILVGILLVSLITVGCDVVCPECPPCPPPEITVEAPDVTVTPEIDVECPEPEIIVEVELEVQPEIEPPDVEVIVRPQVESPDVYITPQIESPDVYVTCAPDYSEPTYTEQHLEIVITNYMWLHRDLYNPLHLKTLYCNYDGGGLWTIVCKMQNPPPSPGKQGSVYYRKLIFDERPPARIL